MEPGVMAFFGLKYNMLTYTEILISIGLSIDYMSHSGYSFVVEEGTSLQRSEKALGAMGKFIVALNVTGWLSCKILQDSYKKCLSCKIF